MSKKNDGIISFFTLELLLIKNKFMAKENIIPHSHKITKDERQMQYKHKSLVLWFTGLSGSGKSTLADAVEQALFKQNVKTYLLDGDNIRSGLNADLDFTEEGRTENIRRISEVAKLFVDAGNVVLTAFISPFIKDRAFAREVLEEGEFVEVFVDCPLEVCEQRDVKGLYQKAREGKIKNFTGIDSPFEAPENPELIVKTAEHSLEECVNQVVSYLENKLKIRN